MNDDEVRFTDAELWKAINEAFGEIDSGDIPEPHEVDPGTITTSELAKKKKIGQDKARSILNDLVDEKGLFIRDPHVKRRDAWTGRIVRRKGYRYVGPPNKDEVTT